MKILGYVFVSIPCILIISVLIWAIGIWVTLGIFGVTALIAVLWTVGENLIRHGTWNGLPKISISEDLSVPWRPDLQPTPPVEYLHHEDNEDKNKYMFEDK